MRFWLLLVLLGGTAVPLAGCGTKPPALPDAGCSDCECTPGTVEPCYGGPDGTSGVGACTGGTRTCDATGHFGACAGEVLPAAETCNGADDDCDGTADEDFGDVTCGVGACQVTVRSCVEGSPQACEPLRPAVREACEGTDDDCDGEIDEGCACQDGDTQPCYSGTAATRGVGACKDGTQTCSNGMWSACSGEVLPGTEVCNGADDNCDGQTDETDPTLGAACTTGLVGVCSGGTRACNAGVLECAQSQQASAEACNGFDDDCDGQVDEGNPGAGQSCTTGMPGACGEGVTACSNESIVCTPLNSPSAEVCDGNDNDCDGVVDEGNPGSGQSCSTGLPGECAAGTTSCTSGALQCVQTQQASAEACDGLDNDCDGAVDDSPIGVGQTCTTALPGICSAGTTACVNGGMTCQQTTQATAETCNGQDDDCDGTVDDGNPGSGAVCSTGLPGVCGAGLTTCSNGVVICQQAVQPSAETCDGQDNDCDGTTDEGNPGGGALCSTGLPGVCSAGTTTCTNGSLQCSPDVSPSAETCDGQDNDCDGTVDDGNPGGGASCSTGLPGVCDQGITACNQGALTCEQATQPSAEVCDGLDNDCDGTVDEGDPGGGASCNTGLSGICAAGTTSCSGGMLRCLQDQQPAAETCNGQDDDCDGQVDEDFDLTSDPNNCGSCGNVCGTTAGALCCSSLCVLPDVNNCGACGVPCANGMILITEIMGNPLAVADSQGEWFEVYNPGTVAIDLRGFVLRDQGTDNHTITSNLPVKVPAGARAVLGINANTATNGGVTVLYQYSSFPIGNSGDEIIIVGFGNTEMDRVVWTSGTFTPSAISKELSVNHQSAAQNDALTNWCDATTTYGAGDKGTPNAVNTCSL